MEKLWILYVLFYGLLKGSREGMKKAALKKSSSTVILFFYTLIGLIFALPFSQDAFLLSPLQIFYIFLKATVVCTAWIFAMAALKEMSVSLYGIMDLSRMVFSTLLGVFILGEQMTPPKAIGMGLVLLGLILVNLKKEGSKKPLTLPILLAALINCFFNAVSGTMDKVLMKDMTSTQLQFWFMFFMTSIYGIVLLIHREKVEWRSLRTNYWIPLMSLSLVLGDRFLFEANAMPQSEVTVMTVIKQSSVVITVLTGWLVFKEKNILYKFFCTAIVLSGIFVAVFF